MGTMLQLPAFPRHGILLNPSPSTSPYSHTTSLPGTPHLLASLSSLSSSASSNSPHNSDADNYFTYSAGSRDASAIPRSGTITPATGSASHTAHSREASSKHHQQPRTPGCSNPQTRKIRFAPLPEPRRDDLALPEVFLDDSDEGINGLPPHPYDAAETPRANSISSTSSNRPNSLLFSGMPLDAHSSADSTTPTQGTTHQLGNAPAPTPSSAPSSWSKANAPLQVATSSTSGSDRDDSDFDLTTPVSPSAVLSSSSSFIERIPQSCPESPISRRAELPSKERRWSTKKLFKPLLGPLGKSNISTEDVLTLGVNQLFRSTTRERDEDGMSSGTQTPAGASTPSRNRSRERGASIAEKDCDFGAPLSRSQSDSTGTKKKRKSSFLSSLTSGSHHSNNDDGLWRTQSATADIRRVKSREAQLKADVKRPRSSSAADAAGGPHGRRQFKMLNGRVYGARRNNLNNVNLFASARSDEPEFVEWGYGGMGSVKSAASVGNNRYSRVQGSSSFAAGANEQGWGKRAPADDDDDGSGMAWLKKRREQREREKQEGVVEEREKREKAKQAAVAPAVGEDAKAEEDQPETAQPDTEVADPDPPKPLADGPKAEDAKEAVVVVEEPEHITHAVNVPARMPLGHGRPSMERVPSLASHTHRTIPDRKGSGDTVRGIPVVDAEQLVGDMDMGEITPGQIDGSRERRESASSGSSSSGEDEDADAEDSQREDDEDDEEDDERTRRTALGAGVEKISRHKSHTSVDGVLTP